MLIKQVLLSTGWKSVSDSTGWKSLSQTVAITDSEIKGSVSFWDLLGADYPQLTPTSQTPECPAQVSCCQPALLWLTSHGSTISGRSSELCTCKGASVKTVWYLKVWGKWVLAVSLSFIHLDPSFHLCPFVPLPCLASLTVSWCWIWGVKGITFTGCWTGF